MRAITSQPTAKKPAPRERPFAGMSEICGKLNRTEKEIMVEVESGRLLWAFNFASRQEKIFLRVYKPAVQHWIDPSVHLPASLDELLAALFPGKMYRADFTDTITGKLFQEAFNLSHVNVTALLHSKLIQARDTRWGMGRSPRLLLSSVAALLKARQLS